MQRKSNPAGGMSGNVCSPSKVVNPAGRKELAGMQKSFSEMNVTPKKQPLNLSPLSAYTKSATIDDKSIDSFDELAKLRRLDNHGSRDSTRLDFDYDHYVSDLDSSGGDSDISVDRLRSEWRMFEESLEFPQSIAEKLALNTVLAARVSDVNAPSKFWLQLQKYDDELNRLHSDLK